MVDQADLRLGGGERTPRATAGGRQRRRLRTRSTRSGQRHQPQPASRPAADTQLYWRVTRAQSLRRRRLLVDLRVRHELRSRDARSAGSRTHLPVRLRTSGAPARSRAARATPRRVGLALPRAAHSPGRRRTRRRSPTSVWSRRIAVPAGTGNTLQFWSFKDIENNGTTACYDGASASTSSRPATSRRRRRFGGTGRRTTRCRPSTRSRSPAAGASSARRRRPGTRWPPGVVPAGHRRRRQPALRGRLRVRLGRPVERDRRLSRTRPAVGAPTADPHARAGRLPA